MLRVYNDVELKEFEAWSGGRYVLEKILEHDNFEEILQIIEDYLSEYEELTETTINDFLWFEAEEMLKRYDFYLFE